LLYFHRVFNNVIKLTILALTEVNIALK